MSSPVTLVTGSSRGIGRALAEHYVEAGHMVVGCARSGSDLVHHAYRHEIVDITDERAVRSLMSSVRSEFGRLDNLINNAGTASMNAALLTPTETVRNLVELNLVATFTTSREAARLMRESGRIVNVSTVAVPLRLAGEAAYVASKAGVEGLTAVLANELGPRGITVNAVGPTPIATDLIAGVPQSKLDDLVGRQAIGRLGTVEDVINVVDFFLSERSDFVTGQVVYLGGVG